MTKQPHPVDKTVGKKLKEFRLQHDISASDFASQIGVDLDQLKKFEDGSARIGSELLYKSSVILDIEVSEFFAGLDNGLSEATNRLISAFSDIDDEEKRLKVIEFAESIAENL